ncbi:uncharacterized protein [Triticum aestivum]|uniref:uncharacterized protein n=1 Tax=Triticum aestivum TaxID=4565 RepID=UPI001D00F654|nr:uncharacterized protein LOC123050752 [Triticum aestivum]
MGAWFSSPWQMLLDWMAQRMIPTSQGLYLHLMSPLLMRVTLAHQKSSTTCTFAVSVSPSMPSNITTPSTRMPSSGLLTSPRLPALVSRKISSTTSTSPPTARKTATSRGSLLSYASSSIHADLSSNHAPS